MQQLYGISHTGKTSVIEAHAYGEKATQTQTVWIPFCNVYINNIYIVKKTKWEGVFDQFSFNSYRLEVTAEKEYLWKNKQSPNAEGTRNQNLVLRKVIMQLFLKLYFKNWYVTSTWKMSFLRSNKMLHEICLKFYFG